MPGACYELQEHNFRGIGRYCGNSKRAAGQEGLGQTPPAAPQEGQGQRAPRSTAIPLGNLHLETAKGKETNCLDRLLLLHSLPFEKLKKKLGTSLAPTSPKSSLWDTNSSVDICSL